MTPQMRFFREDGVSPVVGVMLMLVVTIIIAAMVSSFSSGIVSEQRAAPTVQLSTGYTANIIDNDKSNSVPDLGSATPNNGLNFRLTAGDSFSLKDIAVQLKARDKALYLDMSKTLNRSAAVSEGNKLTIIENNYGNKTYFALPGGDSDSLISVGDSFIVLADSCYDNTQNLSASADQKGRYLTWTPEEADETFRLMANEVLEYKIIDQLSGKSIQTGTIIVR